MANRHKPKHGECELKLVERCEVSGKLSHETRKSAKFAIRSLRQNSVHGQKGWKFDVFRCVHCGYFHVGKPIPGTTREEMRQIAAGKV